MTLDFLPDIVRSAYATLVVTDLAKARRFWVDLLGFVVTCEDSSAIHLRGYDDPDYLVLRWSVQDPRRRDFWGNAVIPSWYSDASVVLDLDGKVRPVTEIAQQPESAARVGADGYTAPAE
jgi:catechol 2,3-dioxygenase-like lactoylglutathione lyase family enzyme